MADFWDISLCSLVEEKRFRGVYCLNHHDDLMMEAVGTSESSFYFNKTTQRYVLEGCHLQSCRRENLKPDSSCNHLQYFVRNRFQNAVTFQKMSAELISPFLIMCSTFYA
jgi:hypothetical protein